MVEASSEMTMLLDDLVYKTELLKAALRCLNKGWAIFPCYSVNTDGSCTCGDRACSNIGKHPATPRGFKDASKDRQQIELLFSPEGPLRNLAVRTGEASGITVVDVDSGTGKVGMQTWLELIREHGEPITLTQHTGGGGFHVFFQYNAAIKSGNDRFGRHVDCKNDDAYVLLAPSRHHSGRTYEWMSR